MSGAGTPEAAQDDLPEPELRIEIDPPIVVNKGSYDEMILREPTAAQVRKAETHLRVQNPETYRRYQMSLVEQVSGLPPAVIDALPVTLLVRADRYLSRFIFAGRPIGEN